MIIFLAAMALLGTGVHFILKTSGKMSDFVRVKESAVRININEVSLDELLFARVMPESMAKRLIAYRKENGKFERIEDLRKVQGIGPKRLEKLAEVLYVSP